MTQNRLAYFLPRLSEDLPYYFKLLPTEAFRTNFRKRERKECFELMGWGNLTGILSLALLCMDFTTDFAEYQVSMSLAINVGDLDAEEIVIDIVPLVAP